MRFPFRRTPRATPFVHPLLPIPRTAILRAGFEESRLIRTFPEGWTEEAARFEPEVIAAPLHTLHELAAEGVEVSTAVIVLTDSLDCPLEDHDREMLWRTFGVPVFEQWLGLNNALLAAECDAHDGMHMFLPTSGVDLEYEPCACGSSVPRIQQQVRARALAATA